MNLSTTNEGFPVDCPICGKSSIVDVSRPPRDSVCPSCGCFLWVDALVEATREFDFVPDLKISQVKSTTRDDAIRELASALGGEFFWTEDQLNAFVRSVLYREDMGSTGIGRGYAVPHAKMDWLEKTVTAIALAPEGISYGSLDGKLVHTIILIASPLSSPSEHLKVLEKISKALIWRRRGGS